MPVAKFPKRLQSQFMWQRERPGLSLRGKQPRLVPSLSTLAPL